MVSSVWMENIGFGFAIFFFSYCLVVLRWMCNNTSWTSDCLDVLLESVWELLGTLNTQFEYMGILKMNLGVFIGILENTVQNDWIYYSQ